MNNPYRDLAHAVLPRVLASFDSDPFSPTAGLADRGFWAWKTKDFANATGQGAVHGLARLVAAGLLPGGMSAASIIARIDLAIRAAGRITAHDGSLVEAFPNEKSFCVTALIAFDILAAADLLRPMVGSAKADEWRAVAGPMIDFICRNDETHGIISNHLATAVAALMLWDAAPGSASRNRAEALLDVILRNQSTEGWFSEYGGFDPGYETLGLTYLAHVHLHHPDLGLREPLARSLAFLLHFAHPDGSFGGGYGARNTRFCVPGGLEALASSYPEAEALSRFLRASSAESLVVTIASLDEPNLAPHFNACCWAAECLAERAARPLEACPPLPSSLTEHIRHVFPKAGLVIDNNAARYAVVSVAKGGHVSRFPKTGGHADINAGVIGTVGNVLFSSQAFQAAPQWRLEGDMIEIDAPLTAVVAERPTVLQFLALRLLCLTVFHVRPLTELVKRHLVRRLISARKECGVVNRRQIVLDDGIGISDVQMPPGRVDMKAASGPFSVIHMASAGYWQAQDDRT
jgi:hypothetical protein